MQGVVVALFWLWILVAIGVWSYRLRRRIIQGPKSVRRAREAEEEGRSGALGPPDTPTLDADTPPTRPAGSVASAQHLSSTVAEALRGIELPGDLVPIVDITTTPTEHRVLFTTRTTSVRSVAAGLADALERLGYQVSDAAIDTTGERRRLIATRSDTVVSIAVGVDPAGVVTAEATT